MLLTPKVATDDPEKTDVNQMVNEVLTIPFSLKLYLDEVPIAHVTLSCTWWTMNCNGSVILSLMSLCNIVIDVASLTGESCLRTLMTLC